MTSGPLIILSGPSGSGKSTLIQAALTAGRFPLRLAVSATTRPPREGERDGLHYYFWSEERFRNALANDELLEHAVVHGRFYGTPRAEIVPRRSEGVILDIDVQGAAQVRAVCPEHVSIFVELPRWEMYESRIRHRGTETEETIQRRLTTARRELERAGEYQYRITNQDLETAVQRLHELLEPHFRSP